jgi:hypothetical protein
VAVTAGLGTPKPRVPKWVGIAAGVAVVAAVGVGVAFVVGKDDPKTTSPGNGAVVDTTINGSGSTSGSTAADTTPGGGAGTGNFDLTPLVGAWQAPCQPYLAGDGGSAQSYEIASSAPDTIELSIIGADYTAVDCTDAGTETVRVTYHFAAANAGQQGDMQAWSFTASAPPDCVSTEPTVCGMAAGDIPKMALGIDAAGLLRLGDPSTGADANGFPTTWQSTDIAGTRK